MKNIQIIDGALNAAYAIYAMSDDDFEIVFPNGQDIEFIEDLFKRVGKKTAGGIQVRLYSNPALVKSEVQGIHGTLFYQLKKQRARYYPNKTSSDNNQ